MEPDDNPEDVSGDSGYLSIGPSESEETGEEATQSAFEGPSSVRDRDWRVYEVFDSITNKFGEKFKAMWA